MIICYIQIYDFIFPHNQIILPMLSRKQTNMMTKESLTYFLGLITFETDGSLRE